MIEPTNTLTFRTLGTIELAGAEISAYDAGSQRVYTTSDAGLQVIDLADPANPQLIDLIAFPDTGGITSVATYNGLVAVAVAAEVSTDPGRVLVLDTDGNVLKSFNVGSLPDMVTFSPDGSKILVANEGEATAAEDVEEGAAFVNPEGSISVIDLSGGIETATVETAGFEAFNDQAEALLAEGVRLFVNSPGFEGTTVAQDLEPEYIAVAPDGTTAWVTLQEANSVAVVDLSGDEPVITDIIPLGLKDWNGLDFDGNDRDGITFYDDLPIFGMYMPDAIASYEAGGETYFVTANEGDDRDDFVDESTRLGSLDLDDATFANEAELLDILGRLNVPELDGVSGDLDGDGDVDQILAYGARSFSIRDAEGNIVFDSGDEIDTFVATYFPELYADGRSDNKGSEPEGVTIAEFEGRTYAFVALERYNSTIVYDITDPDDAKIATFLANEGDVSPESGIFIAADDSANGATLFLVSNESSNTLTVYELTTPQTEGGNGIDDLVGTISDDIMTGGNGADTLFGNFGDDELIGGNGADLLDGGWGDDQLWGGRGDDIITTGIGADVIHVERGNGTDVVTDFDTAEDSIALHDGIEIAGTQVADFDGDGTLDLVLQFDHGGGSLVLLGVTDPFAVNVFPM